MKLTRRQLNNLILELFGGRNKGKDKDKTEDDEFDFEFEQGEATIVKSELDKLLDEYGLDDIDHVNNVTIYVDHNCFGGG